MPRQRNAFDRFRYAPFRGGAMAAPKPPTGSYVTWEVDGVEERYVLTDDGDRVTYDEPPEEVT